MTSYPDQNLAARQRAQEIVRVRRFTSCDLKITADTAKIALNKQCMQTTEMVLELHVWGPAFSLPSIDAQCLATIAYMSQAVPKDEWSLIASNDPSLSPTKELPALRDENVWIGGFRNIVDYVTKHSQGAWCLDSSLESRKKADVIAFSSFVGAHGQQLLDLSLFISSRNYNTITRPLYSKMLPLPMPYIILPALRSAAKTRTAHLNFSALDVDATEAEAEKKDYQNPIPPHLRTSSKPLSSLISTIPEASVLIRLDSLACAFLEPLQTLRGKNRFFVSQQATSFDCLAFAYLALFILPELPSSWLAKCTREKFPYLSTCVHDFKLAFFGGSTTVQDAYQPSEARRTHLPWVGPETTSIGILISSFTAAVGDKLPAISFLRENAILKRELDEPGDNEDKEAVSKYVSACQRKVWVTTGTVVVGLGLFAGFVNYFNMLGAPALGFAFSGPGAVTRNEKLPEDESSELSHLGEAGEALGALLA